MVGHDASFLSSDPQNPAFDFGDFAFMLGQAWAEKLFKAPFMIASAKPFSGSVGVLLMGVAAIAREGMTPKGRINLDDR